MTTIDARTSGSTSPAGAPAAGTRHDDDRSRRSEPAGITDIAATTDAVLGSAHGENFPVALGILPAAIRADFQAIYGFCRLVDDIGDEAPGDRLALLDELDADLARIWSDEPRLPVHQRLAVTVRAKNLPAEPFERLIEANRVDQRVSRYETFDDLLRYCTLSADPVGRMVLGVLGEATPEKMLLSDRVCTALQLAEHFQDVAEDFAAGRIYLPREDMATFGVTEDDLAASTASPALRNLMAFEVARASTILDQGAPLTSLIRGRMRLAIAAFVGGGRAALHAIRQSGYDVLGGAPKASKQRLAGTSLWVAGRSFAPSMRTAAAAAGRLEPLCEPPSLSRAGGTGVPTSGVASTTSPPGVANTTPAAARVPDSPVAGSLTKDPTVTTTDLPGMADRTANSEDEGEAR